MYRMHYKELEHLIGLSHIAIYELNKTISHITCNPINLMISGAFEKNMDLAWHHINGLLIYTARISKILWGSSESNQSQTRGKYIRESLGISEDSIFHHQNRNVRNDFDHIDERLDDIEAGILKKGPSDRNIGDILSMFADKKPADYMRHYDPNSQMIYFGRSNLSIRDLKIELNKLGIEVNKKIKELFDHTS